MKILETLLEYIYPNSIYCLCCGKVIDETRKYSLCDKCIRAINWSTGRTCKVCGKPLEETWESEKCADCMRIDHHFRKGYSCCQYGIHARTIVFSLKYNKNNYIGQYIGEAMADRLCNEAEISGWELMVPVPTEKEKERERGFDHSLLIARETGKRMGIPVVSALERKKATVAQRGLDPISRRENLRNAIDVKSFYMSNIKGKNILLIDDIYTTGATCDECARVLKKAGAQEVDVAVFGAGGNRHNQPLE